MENAMSANYTAVVQQDGDWWIGWVEEVPGVNSQGQTREELLDNLRDALTEALEMNRADALAAAGGLYEEVSLLARSGIVRLSQPRASIHFGLGNDSPLAALCARPKNRSIISPRAAARLVGLASPCPGLLSFAPAGLRYRNVCTTELLY